MNIQFLPSRHPQLPTHSVPVRCEAQRAKAAWEKTNDVKLSLGDMFWHGKNNKTQPATQTTLAGIINTNETTKIHSTFA